MIGMQSIAQLTENYGYALAQGMVDMFSSFLFFRSHHPQTSEWMAKILRIVEQEELHEQTSYGANAMRDGVSFSKQTRSKSLILPSEIANLPDLEAYVKYSGYDVTKIKIAPPQLPIKHQGFVVRDKI